MVPLYVFFVPSISNIITDMSKDNNTDVGKDLLVFEQHLEMVNMVACDALDKR